MNQQAFGRRSNAQSIPRRTQAAIEPVERPAIQSATQSSWSQLTAHSPSLDEELREWKEQRKGSAKIPWRQLSLMASLCFGIASLVLPDSVNDSVDWLLYALMAASLYAGFSKRRKPD